MQKGWDASGCVRRLLEQRQEAGLPYTQQWLADKTGIGRTSINAYLAPVEKGKKHHRDLGMDNAPKIARCLKVTLAELGAPEEILREEEPYLLTRLEQVAVQVGRILLGQELYFAKVAPEVLDQIRREHDRDELPQSEETPRETASPKKRRQ